jgi:branched-chain amino acid transport system permease protein
VFFGTGAYTSTILQVTYSWNPWLAWPVAMAAGGAVGWMIAVLSFRAGLRGSYFALITLAFAEVFRILANSVPFTRGGLGMLIKADPRPINFQFRDPIWIYYLALLLCVVSILIAGNSRGAASAPVWSPSARTRTRQGRSASMSSPRK